MYLLLDATNLIFSGGGNISLQIPDWECGLNPFCIAVKALIEMIVGGLPATIGSVDVNASVYYINGWEGDFSGMVTVGNLSFAVVVEYVNGQFHLLVGPNFEDLFMVFLSEQSTLGTTSVEKSLTLPQDIGMVDFSVVGSSSLPSIYLKNPKGDIITPANVGSFPGVSYIQNTRLNTAFFKVDSTQGGTWILGEDSLPSSDVSFFALSPHQISQTVFESVIQSSSSVDINISVTPADENTLVSLYYSDQSSGGSGGLISSNLPATTGAISATWNTSIIPNGSYYLFAKTDDGKNSPVITYYDSAIAIDNDGIEPPTNLDGTMSEATASLTWIPSISPIVVGYLVRYTDDPYNTGYKYSFSAQSNSSTSIENLDSGKSYRFTVVAYDSAGNFSLYSNSIVLNIITPPAISSLTKLGNPFRLKVYGSNFHSDIQVYIGTDTTPWSNIKYKSDSLIILKGGSALKTKFPKGVPVQIKVVNGDGGYATWTYTR